MLWEEVFVWLTVPGGYSPHGEEDMDGTRQGRHGAEVGGWQATLHLYSGSK